MIESKIVKIRDACASLIGDTIERVETAELQIQDGSWDDWPDLPIRIYSTAGKVLSVSWSRFDDLWITNDLTLPFEISGITTRWRSNRLPQISEILNRRILSVWIGCGEMTIGSRDFEIWTRLLFELGDVWFEVFNALDENGYEVHFSRPEGTFMKCA